MKRRIKARHWGIDFEAKDYSRGLDDAADRASLLEFLRSLPEPMVRDALYVAERMTHDDFDQFRVGLAKERRGEFAGEDYARRFGAIYLPVALIGVSQIADEFKVPMCIAYMRLAEVKPEWWTEQCANGLQHAEEAWK